jgi:hypothetical protein
LNSISRIAVVLFALAFLIEEASAQAACPKDEPWACYGAIELEVAGGEESGVLRSTRFDNGEILAEISGVKSGERKTLVLRPFIKLFHGISDREIKEEFPFIFFEYGFAAPAGALRAAFPLGPESISTPVNNRAVRFDGSEGVLSVARKSATRVDYELVMHGEQKQVMKGYWETAKRRPLPDDHVIGDWTSCALKKYATVGLARRANEECPAGGRSDSK